MRRPVRSLFLLLFSATIAQPFLNYVNAQQHKKHESAKDTVLPSQFRAFVARSAPPSSAPIGLQQRQFQDSPNDVNFVGIPPGKTF